jgi:endonuclease/exonuclease/phosphatase (EEP) superfamily protein YafD
VAILCAGLATAPETSNAALAGPPLPANGEISVVSLNLAKVVSAETILKELLGNPAVRDADVLLFQEVACPVEALGKELGRHVVWAEAPGGQGLAILSRWPMEDHRVQALKNYDLKFRSRTRMALSATIATPKGRVRVWNTHLDTRVNAAQRLEQLAPVVDEVSRHAGPRIIGGDFNSNPFFWVGHVLPVPFVRSQARWLRDYMTGRGFTTALPPSRGTHDIPLMHLDWVWTRDATSRACTVYPMRFSDHHAVLVRVGW